MRRGNLVVLGAILLTAFALRRPFLDVPLVRDEGEHAYIGQRIAFGALPYRDAYIQKTPFASYFMAGILADAGEGENAREDIFRDVKKVRLATLIYGLITICVVYGFAAEVLGASLAPAAGAAFALMLFGQAGVLHQASSEHFMLLWLALGAWAWLKGHRGSALLAGLAFGVAFQCKQLALAALAFPLIDAVLDLKTAKRPREPIERAIAVLLGFASVQATVLAFFAWQGALGVYWECVWTNNWAYVGRRAEARPLFSPFGDALAAAGWNAGLWALGIWGLIMLARSPSPAKRLWVLPAFLGWAALSSGPYSHYFLPLALAFALGAAVATGRLLEWRGKRRWAGLILLALAWLPPLGKQTRLMIESRAEKDRVLARFLPVGAAKEVGEWLRTRIRPGEEILVVGSEPEIYFYARRPASSRMIISYPMTGPYPYSAALREEFLRDLERKHPRVVVLSQLSTSLSEWPGQIDALMRPAAAIVNARYRRLSEAESAGADQEGWSRTGLRVLVLRGGPPLAAGAKD